MRNRPFSLPRNTLKFFKSPLRDTNRNRNHLTFHKHPRKQAEPHEPHKKTGHEGKKENANEENRQHRKNKIGKVRRAKLYYLRKLTGKKARIAEKRTIASK